MKGIIVAGGKGTRLRPLTYTGAKQLVPVANKPVLFYAVEDLVEAGISEIGIVVPADHQMARDQIMAAVGDGDRWGARITYIPQDAPRGIAHAVSICRDFVGDEKFVVFLGDNFIREGIKPQVDAFRHGVDELHPAPAPGAQPPGAGDRRGAGRAGGGAAGEAPRAQERPGDRGHLLPRPPLLRRGGRPAPLRAGGAGDHGRPLRADRAGAATCAPRSCRATGSTPGSTWTCWTPTGWCWTPSRPASRARWTGRARSWGGWWWSRGPGWCAAWCGARPSSGAAPPSTDTFIGPFTAVGDGCRISSSELEHSIVLEQSVIEDIETRIEDSLIGRNVRLTRSGDEAPRPPPPAGGQLAGAAGLSAPAGPPRPPGRAPI